MFYTKAKLNEEVTIKVELNDENVFCYCPECGEEVPVDLSEVFGTGRGDMYSTSVFCKECSAKRIRQMFHKEDDHGKLI